MNLLASELPKLDTLVPNSLPGRLSPLSIPNVTDVLTGNLCCLPSADTAMEKLFPALNQTIISTLLVFLAGQKCRPNTKTEFKKSYDFIIVGAGSAGCALAARLSELSCMNILLLEAGSNTSLLTEVPGLARMFLVTDLNWNYKTEPQKHTGRLLYNNQMTFPSGKAVGGSSIVNAMLYIRGNHKDYDGWAADGAKGWAWKDVFPYFMKLERNVNPDIANNGYHNVSGPVTCTRNHYIPDVKKALIEAAKQFGDPYIDPNGASQIGYSDYQSNVRDGQRCSAAKAYLAPNDHRPNLDIVANAFVKKVVFERKEATGVLFDFNGAEHFVKANREVILSAGAVNTPQLLMLSGIGPKKTLKKHKIPVIADLPGVGQNFQDHCCTLMNFHMNSLTPSYPVKAISPPSVLEYVTNKSGPLTSNEGVFGLGFFRSNDSTTEEEVPNYQVYFLEGSPIIAQLTLGLRQDAYLKIFPPFEAQRVLWCLSSILHPKSKGFVSLRSSDPYDPPIIDPNYFEDPQDVMDVVAGMKNCLKVARSDPMRKLGVQPNQTNIPGCEEFADDEDKYLECHIKAYVFTLNHQVGTAKMGNPKDCLTVVDPKLRVKKVKRLRVVDASIMPKVPSGNTNIPCMMIGEKAADIIKRTITC